jgi:hypothetical protein
VPTANTKAALRLGALHEERRGRRASYKITGERVEHPFRDSIVTKLVKLVDVLPRLNVTNDPELERLTGQVHACMPRSRSIPKNCASLSSSGRRLPRRLQKLSNAWPIIWELVRHPRSNNNTRRSHERSDQHRAKLTRARTQLLLNQPFFGTLCLRLKLMPSAVPTMESSGGSIGE